MTSFSGNKKAFTIVELIVVITIIAVLSGGAALSITANARQARDTRRKADLQQIKSALEFYKANQVNGNYPANAQYRTGINPIFTYPALVPTYLESMPHDPNSTATTITDYNYQAGPAGCNNTTSWCLTYSLTANLEVGGTYRVTPLSIQ